MPSPKFHVLCASGNEDISFMLSTLLEKRGLEVTPAPGPQEALDLSDGRRFDLYILDTPMPRMTAAELSGRIRRSDPEAAVVMFSDFPFDWDIMAVTSADFRGYVVKPDIAGLVRCVERLLGEGRKGQTTAGKVNGEGALQRIITRSYKPCEH